MHHDPLNNLERLKIKPLTDSERSAVWIHVKSRLATTPVESPYSFLSSKMLAYAFVAVVMVTTALSSQALPGNPLYSVKLGIENAESAVVPSTRADHARQRLAEFESVVGAPSENAYDTAASAPSLKSAAPVNNSGDSGAMRTLTAQQPQPMMAMMAQSEATALPKELPPEIQKLVDETRKQLQRLQEEALLKGDEQTVEQIQQTIDVFEARVREL